MQGRRHMRLCAREIADITEEDWGLSFEDAEPVLVANGEVKYHSEHYSTVTFWPNKLISQNVSSTEYD